MQLFLNQPKNKSFPDVFKYGQIELNDDQEIANMFNAFCFTNVGPDQSKNIRYDANNTHQTYLTQKNYDEMNFRPKQKLIVSGHIKILS